jgi:hypothetical protein
MNEQMGAAHASIHFSVRPELRALRAYRRMNGKTLMKPLANRLSPQAGKSLVISTNGIQGCREE